MAYWRYNASRRPIHARLAVTKARAQGPTPPLDRSVDHPKPPHSRSCAAHIKARWSVLCPSVVYIHRRRIEFDMLFLYLASVEFIFYPFRVSRFLLYLVLIRRITDIQYERQLTCSVEMIMSLCYQDSLISTFPLDFCLPALRSYSICHAWRRFSIEHLGPQMVTIAGH